MKFKQLVCLMVTGFCLSAFVTPPANFAAPKGHWALATLEALQSENLLLNVSKDPKKLNSIITVGEFESMLSDIWQSEFAIKSHLETLNADVDSLTRQESAEKIYALFNKNADTPIDPITWIKSAKIMSGYPSGNFNPDDKVTLAQGVSIMNNLKNFIKNHPDVKLDLSNSSAIFNPKNEQLHYIAVSNLKGTIDFTLDWGEKKTGGYQVKITNISQSGKELRISYRLTSPQPGAMVTQALTYPKDTVTLEMGMEAYKQLTLMLVEDNKNTTVK